MITSKNYESVAQLLYYPNNQFPEKVKRIQALLDKEYSKASKYLIKFTKFVESVKLSGVQEIYTRTFDVQAITTLDIGYVLFGDDYKRGELLSNLSREHKDAGVDCGTELGDFLPNLLKLLPKIKNTELRNELSIKIIIPALSKIISEFDIKQLEKKNKVYKKHYKTLIERSENYGVIYLQPLLAIRNILQVDFNSGTYKDEYNSSYTKSISTEIAID